MPAILRPMISYARFIQIYANLQTVRETCTAVPGTAEQEMSENIHPTAKILTREVQMGK